MSYRAAATKHLFHTFPLILFSIYGIGGFVSGEWSFGKFVTYMVFLGLAETLFQLYVPDLPVVRKILDAESRTKRDLARRAEIEKNREEVGCDPHHPNFTMHPYYRACLMEEEVQGHLDGLSQDMASVVSDVMPKVRAIVRSIYRLSLDRRKIEFILSNQSETGLLSTIDELNGKMTPKEGDPPISETLRAVYRQRIQLMEARIAKRAELENRLAMIGPQLETLVETLRLVRDQVMVPFGETRVRVDVDAIVRDSLATEGSLGDVMQAVLDAEEAKAELDQYGRS